VPTQPSTPLLSKNKRHTGKERKREKKKKRTERSRGEGEMLIYL